VDNPARVRHRKELKAQLEKAIGGRERDSLLAALREARVPAGAVYDMAEALAQPTARPLRLRGDSREGLRTVALEGLGKEGLAEPPKMGAQGTEICEELGYSAEKIDELRAQGALGN